jgi:hypothetical protein
MRLCFKLTGTVWAIDLDGEDLEQLRWVLDGLDDQPDAPEQQFKNKVEMHKADKLNYQDDEG